ncbi:MAG: DUF4402 domain-containing protein [Alphaproteobacteria bacterium]|nr:DUF4402 domain-containing protein [Alphaproteobacteria bacterium]MBN2779906.1 DUF4402 domain-containing protein [Alphaproteobacteria bacterium]
MNIFKASLFVLSLTMASNAFAATGTGHAQAELANPLSITNQQNIDFGSVAIDPSAGTQTISISASTGGIACPATYVCDFSGTPGRISIAGAGSMRLSVGGSTATLSDGQGNTLTFDPWIGSSKGESIGISFSGDSYVVSLGGEITFTGNEVGGTYSSSNTGGTGYQITLNYM